MLLEDLLIGPTEVRHPPVMDALSEAGTLQEAQLLDVRVCAVTSTVGLLFDLRTALQLRTANTAVVVGRGVQEFSWSAEHRKTARTAWNVAGSEPARGELFSLSLTFFPCADLRLVSERAEFYVGEVPGLGATPPDYGFDDDARIKAGLAAWTSAFELLQAAFLDLSARA